ncbi:MAG TPA: DegT/DnrJ/EryC1/StrS family aminotransferase, partial [Alteraurantiacibacter sp.]
MADLSRNILSHNATLREVMGRLEEGIGGIVLMVDAGGVLRGVFTDGDVRRALLAGGGMDAPAGAHMNTHYVSCTAGTPREQILGLLSHRVRQVPILDGAGRPVDMLSWLDFWRMAVASPTFGGNELKYVSDCIARGWISSQGDYVGRFEERFATLHGGGLAVSTTSGTTALHLALTALGIGRGDE